MQNITQSTENCDITEMQNTQPFKLLRKPIQIRTFAYEQTNFSFTQQIQLNVALWQIGNESALLPRKSYQFRSIEVIGSEGDDQGVIKIGTKNFFNSYWLEHWSDGFAFIDAYFYILAYENVLGCHDASKDVSSEQVCNRVILDIEKSQLFKMSKN